MTDSQTIHAFLSLAIVLTVSFAYVLSPRGEG